MNRDYCSVLYTVGHIILFVVKQVRTKKSQYITEFMTFESLKKVKLSFIASENGKILNTPLALLTLISTVNICGAVALIADCEETS